MSMPISKVGMRRLPAEALEVVADEPDEEETPVPVATEVTVPVPAVPAWLKRELQEEAVDAVWVLAFEPKSQAVEALLWVR